MAASPIEGLIQPYPSSSLKFDYVDKPYADILDSIATIIIVWSASTIVSSIFHVLQGRTTKSVASKDMMDRLLNVSLAPIFTLRSNLYTAFKPDFFVNIIPRLIGVIGFISIVVIDALVIFSQSSSRSTRSLDGLQLRRISFRQPPSSTITLLHWAEGCFPLVQKSGQDKYLPLRFCSFVINTRGDELTFNSSDKWSIGMSNDKFIDIIFPRTDVFVVLRHSVVMRDDIRSEIYFANLTEWDFNVSPSNLNWMVSSMKGKHPNCPLEISASNSTLSKFSSTGDGCNFQTFADVVQLFHNMFRISEETVRTKNFISEEGKSPPITEKLFTETAQETNKRLSGIILWVIAIVLEIIRILTGAFFWDITKEMDEMVARILAEDTEDSLQYCRNVAFEIVDVEENYSDFEGDHENESTVQMRKHKLMLRKCLDERTSAIV